MARKKRLIPPEGIPDEHGWYPAQIWDDETGETWPPASAKSPMQTKSSKPIGRPREHEWRQIDAEIAWRIVNGKAPRVRTQFRDQMLTWCSQTFEQEPPASTMLEAINVFCDRFGYGRKP
jgi:hypothetical protein